MIKEIIAEVYPWESRVAIVEDGRLAEVFWAAQDENVGKIYKGKIKDILPGLSCVFIDIGLSRNAFLFAGDVARAGKKKGFNVYDFLKSGQNIMVQVKKEAFSEKGARVTGDLSIPGRLLVFLPFQNEVSISRKITGDERRKHLRSLLIENKPENGGIIVRTACLETDDQEIIQELNRLLRVWEEIRLRYRNRKAPSLIYEDMDVLERTMRDYLDGNLSRIVINNRRLRDKILEYISDKNNFGSLMVDYEEGALFEKYNLEKDIRRSLRRKIWLKNGGYLIFDLTEAMTVIDVNSGKFTGKDNFEETVFSINMEAAIEIPRQLRLRSLGGIVLIDFIDMKDKSNQGELIKALKRELEKDKANTRIIGFTGLGFLEMTRKKSRYGVVEFFTDECNYCHGRGHVINLYALASEAKRKMAHMGYLENKQIICKAEPQLYKILKDDNNDIKYIEKRCGKDISLLSDPDLGSGEYRLLSGSE